MTLDSRSSNGGGRFWRKHVVSSNLLWEAKTGKTYWEVPFLSRTDIYTGKIELVSAKDINNKLLLQKSSFGFLRRHQTVKSWLQRRVEFECLLEFSEIIPNLIGDSHASILIVIDSISKFTKKV